LPQLEPFEAIPKVIRKQVEDNYQQA
jgi:hypothetical protein